MRRLVVTVVGAAVVGVLLSVLKGTGGGARLQFGNLSAPWLAVGFVAGTGHVRAGRAAAAGVVATVAALAGFYGQQSPLWGLSSDSLAFLGHPAQIYDFIVAPHRVVFIGATITGALFGVLGNFWAAHRSRRTLAAVALLFVCEPFAWLASGAASDSSFRHYWWLWLAEMALGLAAIVLILRPRPTAP
ncbi:MAG: DUF6518 family protein [Solirubrobacteraceae bacterium]